MPICNSVHGMLALAFGVLTDGKAIWLGRLTDDCITGVLFCVCEETGAWVLAATSTGSVIVPTAAVSWSAVSMWKFSVCKG